MALPQFIEQHGDPQIPPPYSFPKVQVFSFTLRADPFSLLELCNTHLNFGMSLNGAIDQNGFGYTPLAPMVDLEVLTYPNMFSEYDFGSPPFKGRGYIWQNELYFRVWVVKWIKTFGIPHTTGEIEMFIPYIFVNNAWSVITGREVIGYPKVLASFDGITKDSTSNRITMSTHVYDVYDRDTELTERPVVEIVLPADPIDPNLPTDIPELAWPWGRVADVFNLDQLDDLVFTGLLDILGGLNFRTIQCKQSRDAETPEMACHQSLIQAELEVTRGDFNFLKPAKININSYASLRIADELGLGHGELTSVNQYRQLCELLKLGSFRSFPMGSR
ncbi:MAG: acetoacetate decarboxylase family protein [Nitrospirota bacterium]|nr:MAG: acetoacetate decarboxylase family protein [Nitrospirota bacterium]